MPLNTHTHSRQAATQGHAVNTYSTCKLAILHEVVSCLRHDKEVVISNRREKAKEKEKEKEMEMEMEKEKEKEEEAGAKGKVGEKLKDEHQIEAVVVAKKAATKLRKQIKAAVKEKKGTVSKRKGGYIWECMHEEDEPAADSADAGTGASAGANGKGSTDDDVEQAIELFQDTNLDGHTRRIKWEREKVEKQVRKSVGLVSNRIDTVVSASVH